MNLRFRWKIPSKSEANKSDTYFSTDLPSSLRIFLLLQALGVAKFSGDEKKPKYSKDIGNWKMRD